MARSSALVLIHGGQHDSRCWQPTIDAITRDAPGTLPPRQQRKFIDIPGGVEEVIELDTCHNAMISRPDELAAILIARL
jgi:hypothetical protein